MKRSGILLMALAAWWWPVETRAAEGPKPHIVFFLIDDLGYADCGFNGGKDFRTPRIDALARGGAILSSQYVQPVCSPTRAALLTGRYATHTGVYTVVRPHAKWGLPLAERTLANALREAGYETAITGKWHLGEFEPAYLPLARGFDHQYGHYFGAIDYFTKLRDGTRDWYRDQKPSPDEGYSTHLVAREACRLIKERGKEKPLFLYVPFNGVHGPLQVPEEYMKPYAGLPPNRRKLGGMLAAVDEAIGQIIDALDTAGMRDKTMIVFSADNGGPSPKALSNNGPLRAGKGTIYEGGVRGACFAHWPGKIPAGKTIDEPVHIIDWYPTLVKLAGGSLEQKLPLDGKDIWPVLTEGAKSPHESILLVQSPERAALRAGEWKLIMNGSEKDSEEQAGADKPAGTGHLELYQLGNDLGENHNLAAAEPERAKEMQKKLAAMLNGAVTPGQEAAADGAPAATKKPKRKRAKP